MLASFQSALVALGTGESCCANTLAQLIRPRSIHTCLLNHGANITNVAKPLALA